MDLDSQFRLAAFEYLAKLTLGEEDIPVRWADLISFEFDGVTSPLIGQRGIWKPAMIDLPISITTAPAKPNRPAPYDDEIRDDGTIVYRYQGTNPQSHDNVGMRNLMWEKKPLIYFHGIERGLYLAAWPVYLMADHPNQLSVTIDLDASSGMDAGITEAGDFGQIPKRYTFVPTKRRLHQATFRTRVMRAYRRRCAICRLAHESLLDAAHIIADSDARGVAAAQNGLSLCKIHHAAFDRNILGIDPDLVVHVRVDILEEIDGPMLQHGIKEMHGHTLSVVPRKQGDRPSRELLDHRFQIFRGA